MKSESAELPALRALVRSRVARSTGAAAGRWRPRVRHPRTGKQINPRTVIGGPDTFATEAAARAAEDDARRKLVRTLYGHLGGASARERIREAFEHAPELPIPLRATG